MIIILNTILINIMFIFFIIILIIFFIFLIIILIIMILVIVMRARARLTPHLPVNYGNSLQVSTHGRPAPSKSKNRALKRALQPALQQCTANHFYPLECRGAGIALQAFGDEVHGCGGVCCSAWFHCKPRTALCCTACHNSASIADAPNSTLCSVQCSADTV